MSQIAKRRRKIAEKYRVVRFHDTNMQFRYKVQSRFLWIWSDVERTSLRDGIISEVAEYKERTDAIAGVVFVLNRTPLTGWGVLVVGAIAYIGAWLINRFFDWIAPVMPNGRR